LTYHTGDQLEVKIEKMVPNGLGLAFAEKLTVFVPLAVEGDTLAVELRQIKGRTAFAAIIKILDPSPERVEPPCVYFGECGGCDFQQMSYGAQLKAKVGIIRDCLTRIAHIDFEGDIRVVPSKEVTAYRLRTQFHAEADSHRIGFFRRQSHEIIDIEKCLVLTAPMNRTLTKLRESLDQHADGESIANIEAAAIGEKDSIYSESYFEQTKEISIEASGDQFWFNAQSFFQANELMIETLVEDVVGEEEGKTAIDFYCGAGLFSIPLARKFECVVGVESSSSAVGFARKNRDVARLGNLEFFEGRVREFLKHPATTSADLVIVDPPRSGVKGKVLKKIADLCKDRLVYVSCNPSTLARDLGQLLEFGFEINRITAVDIFPQTHHIETVVRLVRRTEKDN